MGTIENMTGKTVSQKEKVFISRGADEIDLVRSGLEETMVSAYREIRELKKKRKRVKDLRTAAFIGAINKVASDYVTMGVFP